MLRSSKLVLEVMQNQSQQQNQKPETENARFEKCGPMEQGILFLKKNVKDTVFIFPIFFSILCTDFFFPSIFHSSLDLVL